MMLVASLTCLIACINVNNVGSISLHKKSSVTSLFDLDDDLQRQASEKKDVSLIRRKRQDTTVDPNLTTPTVPTVPTVPTAPTLSLPGTPGFQCSVELYKRYSSKCCNLPPLLDPLMLQKCNGLANIPLGVKSSGRKRLQINFKARQISPVQKNSSILATVDQICMTYCIFKNEKWINSFNSIDENFMYPALGFILPQQTFGELLAKARTECTGIANSADATTAYVTNAFGRKCYVAPAKMLRCIKRYFLVNCTSLKDSGRACLLDLNTLRTCDPNLL